LQYAPLRKEFRDAPAKEIFNNLETVMVTFGGADICDLTPKVLKLLVDAYPQLKKKVVAGRSFENTAEIETVKDSNTELVYYPDAAEMKKVMLESDIAISAGGQTLYELARVGVPTIMVAAADNQSANIRGWRKAGFAEYAGDWKDEELPEKICRKIEILKDRNARENRSQHGREIIDGKGGSRIAKEVLSDFCTKHLSLRKATLADAKDLFNLANEDIVRRNSFSQDKIEWVSHQRWLNDRLGDSNCLFLIVTCSGEFTGQVRFDITLPQAVINISLCRNIRGLDLSALVINKSIEELLKARKDVKRIKAYVKNGNIASMKAFENAGFSFLEDTVFKGCETRVYERSFGNE
jgi:UDP-2,4-diacetamido-2,4,6-trideoxy-beta-L-altropyranose hydrolase